jgi:hypothetical protein
MMQSPTDTVPAVDGSRGWLVVGGGRVGLLSNLTR